MEQLADALEVVAAIDPCQLVDAQGFAGMLEELCALDRRLDHEWHRLLRGFEASGACEVVGYRTTKQWCRDRLRMSGAQAGRQLKLGRALAQMPTVDRRWARGELGAEHARLIASARTEDIAAVFDEWEPWLAQQGLDLDHRGPTKAIQRWKLAADPDTDEPERAERDRDAHVSTTFDGNVRADAVVEMAIRAEMTDTPTSRRPRPLVTVVTGLDALADGLAELWDETPITARQLARILELDPDIERFVYGSGERPIAYNEKHRLFTGKLRRAIQVRDRTCTALGCDLPAERCDVDHIDPVQAGGRTEPANGRVSCNPDNRARARGRRHKGDPDVTNAP